MGLFALVHILEALCLH